MSTDRPQTANARAPASSFDSYRSGVGSGAASAVSALFTSSWPQPLYGSRQIMQRLQPVVGVMSSAERSSSAPT